MILVYVYFVYQLSWIYFVYNWIGIIVHVYFFYQMRWQVGLSTSQSGSGLCPTWNRPDGIGWHKISLAADHQSRWVKWIKPLTSSGRVSCHHRSEWQNCMKTMRKTQIWQKSHWNLWDFAKSDQNLAGSTWNISWICVFSSRFGIFSSGSGFIFCWNMEFFFRNMGFLSEYGFFADWFTFLGFKGREIEIDPP